MGPLPGACLTEPSRERGGQRAAPKETGRVASPVAGAVVARGDEADDQGEGVLPVVQVAAGEEAAHRVAIKSPSNAPSPTDRYSSRTTAKAARSAVRMTAKRPTARARWRRSVEGDAEGRAGRVAPGAACSAPRLLRRSAPQT